MKPGLRVPSSGAVPVPDWRPTRWATPDEPLLSALVLGPGGGPVPFFRDILKAAGLAVPRIDEALLKIWHREQDRAHAGYANPPKELPPRLAPQAG
ncbi:hypothetical protein [Streptomyces sp. NPDC002205]|uniref:hypothetical protein n=1 Tax=Streptomyces sp. NPDC002205 TaxID=3154411 RepID=UPI00331E066D